MHLLRHVETGVAQSERRDEPLCRHVRSLAGHRADTRAKGRNEALVLEWQAGQPAGTIALAKFEHRSRITVGRHQMILAIGIDIVEVARIERAIDRLGQRFIERIYTEAEAGYCGGRPSAAIHFAGRFAAKESAMKALGTGWGDGVSWRDVEILPGVGPPRLEFHGIALDRFRELGAARAFVSISHTGGMAVAQTIIEGD